MIIYLYGLDSYRRQNNLNELIKAYKNKYKEIDLLTVDLEDNPDDWIKMRDFLNQPSMFVESKVAVVRESGIIEKKEWLELLKSHLKSSKTFILISDKDQPKKIFQFLLKEPVQSKRFDELKGEKLTLFLRKEIISRNLKFVPEAWQFFLAYIDSSVDKSWLAVSELDKLSLAGFRQPVALKDLQTLINWLPKEEVYLITRQLASHREIGSQLGLLEKILLQKEEPARIFNSLVYQARGNQVVQLAEYDVSVKSGGLEYEEVLLDFVLS